MKYYPSIETVWTRQGKSNVLNVGEFRDLIHEFIPRWELTEKVDGMNISVVYSGTDDFITIRGRTDRADVGNVVDAVNSNVPHWETVREFYDLEPTQQVILYGEAYGAGIGKNGKRYRDTKGFILFDIARVNTEHNTHFYLDFAITQAHAEMLGVEAVPTLGTVQTQDIPQSREDMRNFLPYSFVANKHGNDYEGEGIVARPTYELQDKFGNRIVWKLCNRDLK